MKLKKEPTKPDKKDFISEDKEVRGDYRNNIRGRLHYGMTLKDIIEECHNLQKIHPNAILVLEQEPTYYESESPSYSMVFKYHETDEDKYKAAQEKYFQDKILYDKWYAENKDEIEAEITKRNDYKKALKELNKQFKK